MRRWLITGGCGFIGCNLVRHLLAEGGHRIRVLDNLEVGRAERLRALGPVVEVAPEACGAPSDDRIELVVGDILDADVVRASTRGCEVLVHLAANTGVALSVQDPRRDCLVNVVGTLELPRGGARTSGRRASCSPRPARRSARSSRRSTKRRRRTRYRPTARASSAAKATAPPTSAASASRPWPCASATSMARDPDHKSSVVAAFIRRAIAGEPLEIYGDGGQTRDFIFVDDLVRAICKAATVPGIGGQVFHIATAKETTISELAEVLRRILAQHGFTRTELRNAPPRTGDVRRNFADASKAAALLGLARGSASGRGPRSRRTLVYAAGRGQSRHAGAGAGRAHVSGRESASRALTAPSIRPPESLWSGRRGK